MLIYTPSEAKVDLHRVQSRPAFTEALALQARWRASALPDLDCSGSDLTASYFGPGRQRPSAAQLLDLVGAKAEDDEAAGLVFCSRALLYAGV